MHADKSRGRIAEAFDDVAANVAEALAEGSDTGALTLYVDVESVLGALVNRLGPGVDAPNGPGHQLQPVKSLMVSSSATQSLISLHLFVVIR